MDNGLVLASAKILTLEKSGLNPFCNGQWSRTLCVWEEWSEIDMS